MSAFIFGIPPPGVQSEPVAEAVVAPASPSGPAKANPATKRGSDDSDTSDSRKKPRGDPSAAEAARLQAISEAAEATALARAEEQAAAEEDQRQAVEAAAAAEQARQRVALEEEQRRVSEVAVEAAAVERARVLAEAAANQVPSSPQDIEVQRLQQQLQQWRNLSNRAVPLEFDAAVERIQTQIWMIEEQLMRLGQQVPQAPVVPVVPVVQALPRVVAPTVPVSRQVAGQAPFGSAAAAASASSAAASSSARPKKPTKQALSPEGLSQTEMLELRAHLARQMFLDEQGKPLADPQRTLAVRPFKPTGKARKKASIDPQFVQRQTIYMTRVRGDVEEHVLQLWAEAALLPDTRRWLRQLLTYHANLTHAALITAQKVNGPQFAWGTSFASHVDPLEIHVDRTEEECRARNKKKKFEYHALLCLPRNKPFYALLTANERDLADKIKRAGGRFTQPMQGDQESSGDEGNDSNEEDQYATEDDEDVVALAQFRGGGPATTPAAIPVAAAAASSSTKRPATPGGAAAPLVTAAMLAARQRAASTIVLSDDSDNDLPMPAAATSAAAAASAEPTSMNDSFSGWMQ